MTLKKGEKKTIKAGIHKGLTFLCLIIVTFFMCCPIISCAGTVSVSEADSTSAAAAGASTSGNDTKTSGSDTKTVKIGYYFDADYFYKDKDGNYCGYDAEYNYEVSKYTNWNCEYVDFDSFESAYAALEAGKIDILPALFYSEERARNLLLSDYSMGSIYVTIVVSPDNDTMAYNDYKALEGKNVGILKDGVDGKRYREWAEKHDLDTDIIEMSSTEELLTALDEGKLDAVAISFLGSSSPYRIVQEFSPMEMYFGMPKKDTKLMDELNDALAKINVETPAFDNDLHGKYYVSNQKQTPVFTEDEQAFIKSGRTLKVALAYNDPPFLCSKSGEAMEGSIIDYFNRISQMSGLKFSYVGYKDEKAAINAVKNGKADIVGEMVYDSAEATADNIILTNSYINIALTQVTLKGTDKVKTIAIPKTLLSTYEIGSFENNTGMIKTYDSSSRCIDALKRGEVDGAIINTYSAEYYMNSEKAGNYNITTLNGLTYNIAAGVCRTQNNTLYNILNGCIRYSSLTTMNELLVRHSQSGATSFQAIINRIPSVWIAAFAIVMFGFVVFLVILIVNRSKQQKEKDALTLQSLEVAQREAELAGVEKAAEEKDRFFSNISHDMRTPLNAILGFSRLSSTENDPQKLHDYNEKIQTSGELLLDLINDTLTISKMRNNKIEPKNEPVKVHTLLETIIIPIREAAKKKNLTFTVDSSDICEKTVMADKLNMQKIFLNLLSNSVKYTPEYGHIELRAYNDWNTDSGSVFIFVISDNGIGISPEFLPHIFEPFAQEKQHGYESVGTGLGLSIVKQLVDNAGGTINVKSEKGKGTRFTVRLPFDEVDAEDQHETNEMRKGANNIRGKKVLLCEDNAMNREIAVALLNKQGVIVDAAENGQIGLEKFKESESGEYAAILMDVRMPVMDGYEASRQIRGLEHFDAESIPIIAITADAFDEDARKCLEAGMNDYVSKPIDPQHLYSVLGDLIK